jgi:hypothetical protein
MQLREQLASSLPGGVGVAINNLLEPGEVIHMEGFIPPARGVVLTSVRLLVVRVGTVIYNEPKEARWDDVEEVSQDRGLFFFHFRGDKPTERYYFPKRTEKQFASVLAQLVPLEVRRPL